MPMRFMRILLSFSVSLFFGLFGVSSLSASVNSDLFPVYDSIKKNVAFWEMVYAKYPRTKGLIHDSDDLSIIYEVIDLLPSEAGGAVELNKEKVNNVKEKYRKILLAMAEGRQGQAENARVIALFQGNTSSARFKKAAESIRFQLCQKDHFVSGVIRSGAHLEEIKEIFRSYDLPEDLAYLPHVESSYNYKAYSKFGAAGIWQFTHSTGKRFMTVDYVLDERRDPIRATHAAARFLKENYLRLGDWPLAITAYNHGPNGMSRAKKQKGGYENILKEYESKSFGFASRNFYSEFIAARKVARNYKKYFGELELDKPVDVYEIEMPGFASVKDLSSSFKVDLATLKELNPALRPPVFEGRKYVPQGYRLRLPAQKRNLPHSASAIAYQAAQKRSHFYQVQRGDTAGSIARTQKIRLQDLLLANGLDSRARIYVGQNLRLPEDVEKGKKVQLASAESVILKAEFKKKPIQAEIKPQVSTQKTEPLQAKNKEKTTTSLRVASIQETLPLSAAEPQKEAVLADTIIGENAVVELSAEGKEEIAKESDISPEVLVGNLGVEDIGIVNGVERGTIRIEVDETLGHIAEWLNVSASSLRRLNGLSFKVPLRLDQQLKIEFAKVSKEDFEEKRYEYHKEIEEDFFNAYKIEGAILYRIKQGDNTWTLSHDTFDLPFWLIRKYNTAHDFNNLKHDELLIIPEVGKINAN